MASRGEGGICRKQALIPLLRMLRTTGTVAEMAAVTEGSKGSRCPLEGQQVPLGIPAHAITPLQLHSPSMQTLRDAPWRDQRAPHGGCRMGLAFPPPDLTSDLCFPIAEMMIVFAVVVEA